MLSLALVAGGSTAASLPGAPPRYDFPKLTGRVVDRAHVLSPRVENQIAGQSAALERATGHQFVIVTVPGLDGHSIEDYGLALGNHWHVGRKNIDDGVLLIVAPTERKVRIEVGKGLEQVLTNDEAAAILQKDVLPAFRAGSMERGVQLGVDDVVRELSPPTRKAA